VRFEKAQQRREQVRLTRSAAKLVGPDSGQVDEPLRPTLVTDRCRKRGEGKSHWVIVVRAQQCEDSV